MSINNPVTSYPVSNEVFLRAVFGNRWGEALVAYFPGDPRPSKNRAANFTTYPASTVLAAMSPKFNNYYDIALPMPGGTSHKLADFGALCAIVVDDIGTKVDLVLAQQVLGLASYLLETSPANFQAGWICDPITDRAWANGMLRVLHAALGADNLKKITTLVRLPVGTNGKIELGSAGFPCRLPLWQPQRRIVGADWIGIEKRIGTITPLMPRVSLSTAMPDPAEVEADPILRVFRDRGMVLGLGREMTFGWGFEVTCPWAGDHSDPRTEAGYVPVKGRFKCHHGHCVDRTMDDVRSWADAVIREDSGGLETLAAQDFDVIAPITVPLVLTVKADTSNPIDQWDSPPIPKWPGGVYPSHIEAEIAACARQNQYDHGGLAIAVLGAVSAGADKRIKLKPYAAADWTVPPIIWFMLVADSGNMKSGVYETAMEPVQQAHNAAMARWTLDKAAYAALPLAQRKLIPPPEMMPVLLNDATVEGVQMALTHTPRGLAILRDELAGFMEFDRYASGGGGQATRAFYLESYEAKSFTLVRVKRGGLHLPNSGIMIGGATHPHRVRKYIEVTEDGLLQRFIKIRLADVDDDAFTPASIAQNLSSTNATIERLFKVAVFGEYTLTTAGEKMVRETQAEGRRLARTTDLGPAFASEAGKMHGLHARVALLLHLMETPDVDVISDDVVRRAKRLIRYTTEHSTYVYTEGGARATQQTIASYLLRLMPEKITARDLLRNVRVCRGMTTKDLNTAMEPLVNGGWVKPASQYQTNRLWLVNQNLQRLFPERLAQELVRVETQKVEMNQLGRYD